jgi:hypothetical protein
VDGKDTSRKPEFSFTENVKPETQKRVPGFCYNDCCSTKGKRMKQTIYVLISTLAALALFLSACGGETQPTPDTAAISTAAAQTVEARFTLQAVLQNTETPPPPLAGTPVAAATSTLGYPPTLTTEPGLPTPTSNGKACYVMTFLADITIPDGMIIAPGANFTKTWRVRNDGNCVWDKNYSVVLDQGDAMSTVTNFPLTKVVNPGDSLDISIDMTAPTVDGIYSGYWHIATPYGGYIGIAGYNQSLFVKVHVTAKSNRYFGADNVVYDWTRKPQKGCTNDGAYYNFSATITVNGPGEIGYRWDYHPWDGNIVGGTLKFASAGSKTIYWTWHMTTDHIQDIDRWVAITTIVGSQETQFSKVTFNYTCKP